MPRILEGICRNSVQLLHEDKNKVSICSGDDRDETQPPEGARSGDLSGEDSCRAPGDSS